MSDFSPFLTRYVTNSETEIQPLHTSPKHVGFISTQTESEITSACFLLPRML